MYKKQANFDEKCSWK